MGIFGALTTSVGGMQSQSFALQNISGNIANSQTTAFKRTDTSFSDLVSDAVPNQQIAGSVLAFARSTNTVQGDIQNSSLSTFMAINGEGFFAVQKPGNFVDGRPVFEGVDLYTRRGDFQLDRDGYLVNGAGYYLKALRVDPTTGNIVGSVPDVIQFQNDFLPARASSEIEYRANLATYPRTSVSDPDNPRSELISPASYANNPIATAPLTARMIGTTATLSPDAPATVTGAADISALVSAGGNLVINGTPIVIAPGANAAAIEAAIDAQAGATGVSASIVSNQLVLTSANADTNITVDAATSDNLLTELGIQEVTTNATNLITQGAVSNGQTLTVQVNSGAVQTVTFGTGGGQVSTLAELNAALGGLVGLAASVNAANGNISLVANTMVDTITVGGSALVSRFGLTARTVVPSNGGVIADDETTFLSQSISGGAITTYDVNGSPVNLQFRWVKSDAAAYGGVDTWHMFYQEDSRAAGQQLEWRRVPQAYAFSADGQLTPPIATVTVPGVSVNGVLIGDITLNHGIGGLTQYADPNGNVSVTKVQQNGYPAGDLIDIAVSEGGRIVANYSNGRSAEIAEIPLYSFYGPNFLKKLDGGAFSQTSESGPPVADASGGIIGKALEGSNTDIADEFTKLIVTQQAYSANTRVITTSNQMLQDVLNIIR